MLELFVIGCVGTLIFLLIKRAFSGKGTHDDKDKKDKDDDYLIKK